MKSQASRGQGLRPLGGGGWGVNCGSGSSVDGCEVGHMVRV